MKSFNNWIFIELKEFGRRRLFVIICLADASSKRPVKHSHPFDCDAHQFIWPAKTFPSSDVFSVRLLPPSPYDGVGRYAEWVSSAAENKIDNHLCDACDEASPNVERWPFAMISFILC